MMNRYGKKGIAFLPLILIFALVIIALIIIIKNPEFCIFGSCFRLVPLRWGKALFFWFVFISFFLIIGAVIYIYYWVLSRGISQAKRIFNLIKTKTIKIEQYFLRMSE